MLQFLCQKCEFLNYTIKKGIQSTSFNKIKHGKNYPHIHQNVLISITVLRLQWYVFIIKCN